MKKNILINRNAENILFHNIYSHKNRKKNGKNAYVVYSWDNVHTIPYKWVAKASTLC